MSAHIAGEISLPLLGLDSKGRRTGAGKSFVVIAEFPFAILNVEILMSVPHKSKHKDTPAIESALSKSSQAKETVRTAADELAVVHAVLDKNVPKESVPADVRQAVRRTDELEKKLSKSAELLDEVTETLEAGVKAQKVK
jgi:hypothetical protein